MPEPARFMADVGVVQTLMIGAFGYDAWQLVAYLERLALSADGRIEGATGTLRIDGFGNVQRTPSWSTFRGGVAVPL